MEARLLVEYESKYSRQKKDHDILIDTYSNNLDSIKQVLNQHKVENRAKQESYESEIQRLTFEISKEKSAYER